MECFHYPSLNLLQIYYICRSNIFTLSSNHFLLFFYYFYSYLTVGNYLQETIYEWRNCLLLVGSRAFKSIKGRISKERCTNRTRKPQHAPKIHFKSAVEDTYLEDKYSAPFLYQKIWFFNKKLIDLKLFQWRWSLWLLRFFSYQWERSKTNYSKNVFVKIIFLTSVIRFIKKTPEWINFD